MSKGKITGLTILVILVGFFVVYPLVMIATGNVPDDGDDGYYKPTTKSEPKPEKECILDRELEKLGITCDDEFEDMQLGIEFKDLERLEEQFPNVQNLCAQMLREMNKSTNDDFRYQFWKMEIENRCL